MSGNALKVSRHWKYSLWIIAALTLAALLAMSIMYDTSMIEQLLVVVVFSLISAASFVVLVRQAVKNGKRSLMKTFLVHSTLRMLAAAALIVVYANIKGWIHAEEKKSLLAFVILFAVFYLILLIFDAVKVMKWQGAIGHTE